MSHKIARLKEKGMVNPTIRIMIVGIPNVGKSSFINKMVKKNRAKVEDRPGVTRGNQWYTIAKNLEMLDTPGVLWPSLTIRQSESTLRSQVRLKIKFLISNFWR